MNDTPRVTVPVEWHREDADRCHLIYSLMQRGWRKGQPVMVNDVMIRVEAGSGSDTDIVPIADAIQAALSAAPAPEGGAVAELAAQLARSISGLGYPVGLGQAPNEADCQKAATAILMLYGPAVATREEAPAEAGEIDLYDDKVQAGIAWTMRQWGETLGLTRWDQGDGSESVEGDVGAEIHTILVDAGLRDPETNEMAALRAQPPAREDAQPVARVSRKGNATGSLVWTDHGRASDLPDDAALFSAPLTEGRGELKREIYDNLCAADNQDIPLEDYPDRILSVVERYTHPAPDALRVTVESLEWAIAEIKGDTRYANEGQREAALEKAQSTLAALQAEQGAK